MNHRAPALVPKKIIYRFLLTLSLILVPFSLNDTIDISTALSANTNQAVEIWWPQQGAVISGTQPFKAVLAGANTDTYTMYWQVDNGALVPMETSLNDHPHKEALVDVSSWTWRDTALYEVNFIAKDLSGNTVSQKTISIKNQNQTPTSTPTTTAPIKKPVSIWWPSAGAHIEGAQPFKAVLDDASIENYRMYVSINGGTRQEMKNSYTDHPHKELMVSLSVQNSPSQSATFIATDMSGTTLGESTVAYSSSTAVTVPPTPVVSTVPTASFANPFAGETFYVNPYSNAKRQSIEWSVSRPNDATELNKIGNRPDAEWFGNWNADIEQDVRSYVAKVQAQQGALPVLVAYNIPQRDCGGYSSGGANTPTTYKAWVRAFARGLGTNKAVVILEPDALPGMDCLSGADKEVRLSLLKDAVEVLKEAGNTAVYIDAGHANWNSASETATRLFKAGIAQANGFSLNISNFVATQNNIAFGTAVSGLTGGKHFIIDTSRNGNGSNGEWCNPSGRALGSAPTASTGNTLIDAYFWIKKPGDSDGSCNGAPHAGVWMPEYALELARNTM